MSENSLYVGNLPFSTTEAEFEDAFGAYATVRDVSLVTDREAGRSRGFAFVEMETDEEAPAAIEGLAEQDFGGRRSWVNVARPRPPRGGGGQDRW